MAEETKSIGKELKNARRAKNWSVERAAYSTKLRSDIITKIEADRYDLLPNPAYARGFVRIYARELGLDPYPILKRLNGVVDELPEHDEFVPETLETLPTPPKRQPPKTQNIGLIVIVVAVLGGLFIGGIQLYRIWPVLFGDVETPTISELAKPIEEKPSTTEEAGEVRRAEPVAAVESTSTEEPVIKKAEPVVDIPVGAHHLKLTADEDCWAKIQVISGDKEITVFEGTISAGTTMPADSEFGWNADAFIISLQDTSKINIIFNNQNYGKYDRPGSQTFRIPAN